MNLQYLKNHYESNKIDYDSLIKSTRIVGEYTDNYVLDIVVPNYHRDLYCAATIKHLIRSLEYLDTPVRYNLIIMSFNDSKLLESLALENGIVYLYCDKFPTNHEGKFSRALSFNLPINYFNSSSKWILCHDSDLLVDQQFMLNVLNQTKECNSWIQPYEGRRVSNLSVEDTKELLEGKFLTLSSLTVSYPKSGAMGGSVLVPTDLLKNVGGYDPELFWGYGPEDATFWGKLENTGDAKYSKDTTVYHMNHPPSYLVDHSKFILLHQLFLSLTHEDRKDLIKYKRELYRGKFI